jgi:hypothetical protein
LPLNEWRETQATMHMWLQIVGKTQLALTPIQNHWWNAALRVTARGLATSPMPIGSATGVANGTFDIELDFVDHVLVVRTSGGERPSLRLRAQSVAGFFREYRALLQSIGEELRIYRRPVEVAEAIPFDEDETHASYDADAAQRCWRILAGTSRVLDGFRAQFLGKCSPAHFWWGGFDISCTRFSGRPAPRHPGGIPNCPDYVTLEAYSHECISAGWWPGEGLGEPAFYAYAYPEPAGCPTASIRPVAARYHSGLREWILPYDAVRQSPSPEATLTEFLESTYAAAATLGGWDRSALERQRREASTLV